MRRHIYYWIVTSLIILAVAAFIAFSGRFETGEIFAKLVLYAYFALLAAACVVALRKRRRNRTDARR